LPRKSRKGRLGRFIKIVAWERKAKERANGGRGKGPWTGPRMVGGKRPRREKLLRGGYPRSS